MRRSALLCWEAGRGYGHALALLAIARRLEARGWRPVLAFPPDRLPAGVDTSAMTMRAAPVWGAECRPLPRMPSSTASLGDILSDIGLRSAEWVRNQISGWWRILAECRPDVIVADYAPGAILAARGRIPSIAYGVGFTVPPAGMRRFPPLHDLAPPLHDETSICAAVNSVLADLNIRAIASLADTLTGDAQCVATLPLLDPYDASRSDPVLGPQLDAPIPYRSGGSNEIFCYLREAPGSDRLDAFASCLLNLPGPVVAFMPGLARQTAERLRSGGVTLLDGPAPLATQLRRSRLVVHFGSHGVAAAALLAGAPQLILDLDIEKLLIAAALTRRGVARRFDYYQAEPGAVRTAILTALDDTRQAAEAESAAREHDDYRDRDVAHEVAETCLQPGGMKRDPGSQPTRRRSTGAGPGGVSTAASAARAVRCWREPMTDR